MAEDYNIPVEETPVQQDQGYNIPVVSDPSMSSDLANKRAIMSDYGLRGKINKSYADYYDSYIQGQEKVVRDYVTSELDKLNAQRKAQQIIGLAQQGWPLTEEDISNVERAYNDPRSVIEDHYAQRYMDYLHWPMKDPENTTWLREAYNQIPNKMQEDINFGTEYAAGVNFLQTKAEDAAREYGEQSYLGWTWDLIKDLTTLYPWIKMHTGGPWYALPGEAQEATRKDLLTLPYEQMKNRYMEIYNSLPPNLRLQFAQNMLGMSTDERTLQNFMPIITPGIEVTTLGGFASAVAARNAWRTAIRQQIQSTATQAGLSPTQAAALASGNIGQSATQRAFGSIVNAFRRADPIKEAEERLPEIFRIARREAILNNGGDINGTNMILEQYDRIERELPALLKNLTLPERFPALTMPERTQEVLVAARQAVIDQARNISDRFLNVEEPYQDPFTRAWWANAIIGRSSVEQFGTVGEAGRFAAKVGISGHRYEPREYPLKPGERVLDQQEAGEIFGHGFMEGTLSPNAKVVVEEGAARIEQRGTGWVIVKPYLIPEDSPAMKAFYARLPTDVVPEGGFINSFMARFRTPNETQSVWANRNRESAAFVSSAIEQYAWDQLEAIRKMRPIVPFTKTKWDDFERILNSARSEVDPDTAKIGRTYKNIGELQQAYMTKIGRTADEQEVAAYFAFKRINEMDHVLRTMSILKHKQRQGTMSHTLSYVDQGLRINSPEFDAISMNHFPGGDDTVAIMDKSGNVIVRAINKLGMRIRTKNYTQSYKDYFTDAIEKGSYKIVELYAPEWGPLAGFKGIKDTDHVRYVLAPSSMLSNKPLDWNAQLPWRGGGHFIYKHNIRISQPDIREEIVGSRKRQVLWGVNTFGTMSNLKDGRIVVDYLNQARELLSKVTAQNIAAARDIVENKLGMNWQEFSDWFRPPQGRSTLGQYTKGNKPRFNLTEPFRLHMANENLLNKIGEDEFKRRYPNFLDSRTTSRNQKFITEFSQERDANEVFTWNQRGTPDNPFYAYEPSPLMDAIPTLNRAVNKIANTTAMDDMKIQAVMSWIQDAKNSRLLNVPDSQLDSAPLYWFHHGDLLKDTPNAKRAYELEIARQQIKNFIGQVSMEDAVTHYWAQKLSDTIYSSRFLSKYANKLDPIWIAHTLQDPTRFFRAMTFHMKLGLFAIPQIFVQGQTYANIFAIAGATRATQGTAGAFLHQMSRFNQNPNILAAIGRHAEKFGYKPGEWEDIYKAGHSTGFFNVGSEYALKDYPMSNKVIRSRWGDFLNMGAWPFTEGERNVRFGAWYTAAKEYAEKKAVSQWTNADKLAVLDRASILNGNMNRASNALYQKGWTSLPAQFLTYTIRQAELFWGHRLTRMEKARLLTVNALAYGLPVGLGITGLPSNIFKEEAIKYGYNPSDNYLEGMIGEGVPAIILALIDHDRYWNVGERMGNTGLNDILYSDKPFWDLVTGATGSILRNVFTAFDPIRRAVINGTDGKGRIFYDSIWQAAQELSSIGGANRAWVAAKTGAWISKNGERLIDKNNNPITPPEAMVSWLTGLQPQGAADIRHYKSIESGEMDGIKKAERFAIEYANKSIRAYDDGDVDNGKAFMNMALTYVDGYIPEDMRSETFSKMFDGLSDVLDRVRKSFGTSHVPPGLERTRAEQWMRSLSR